MAIDEIPRLFSSIVDGRPLPLSKAADYLEFCAAERSGTLEPDRKVAVARWRAFLDAGDGRLPTSRLELGLAPGELCPLVTEELDFLSAPEAADIERWCRDNGGSIFSGLLAGFGLATRNWYPRKVVRILVPLQVRPDPASVCTVTIADSLCP